MLAMSPHTKNVDHAALIARLRANLAALTETSSATVTPNKYSGSSTRYENESLINLLKSSVVREKN